ncbi:MAG: sensor histidine kinase, partial [Planctomycetota bacterium]
LHDPVIAFNEDGSFRRANEAARSILQLDPGGADPIATLADELRARIARVRDAVLQGKGPQAPRGFEGSLAVLIGGKPHYLQPLATPIRSEASGAVIGVTVLLRDVTTLRHADELKNDLLSTVAHEIRTPLTSIRMALHLTLEGTIGPVNAKQEEILAAARDDAERLHSIVEGILSAARIEAGALVGRRHPASPRALVERAVAPLRIAATDKSIALSAEAPDAPLVAVDEESAVLVLTNMLVNALKHTPQGGKIGVRVFAQDGRVRFEVSDTGPGIAAQHLPHLFEKFYRVPGSPTGGSGLGLSIARDVVFAHEGEIGVESEVGQGSRFWFHLPAVPPEGSSSAP